MVKLLVIKGLEEVLRGFFLESMMGKFEDIAFPFATWASEFLLFPTFFDFMGAKFEKAAMFNIYFQNTY